MNDAHVYDLVPGKLNLNGVDDTTHALNSIVCEQRQFRRGDSTCLTFQCIRATPTRRMLLKGVW